MKAYPQFRSSYSHEEMIEHFLLTPAELQLVLTCRGDANRCGMASLAMSTPHFGFAWQRGAAAFYRENRKSTKRPSVAKINPTLDLAFRI